MGFGGEDGCFDVGSGVVRGDKMMEVLLECEVKDEASVRPDEEDWEAEVDACDESMKTSWRGVSSCEIGGVISCDLVDIEFFGLL